jgi:hypothetical protein
MIRQARQANGGESRCKDGQSTTNQLPLTWQQEPEDEADDEGGRNHAFDGQQKGQYTRFFGLM